MSSSTSTTPTTTDTARSARIEAIRNGAVVRAALGQAAHHELLLDGRHHVSVFDQARGRLREGTGATVAEAIAQIQGGGR